MGLSPSMHTTPVNTRRALPSGGMVAGSETDPLYPIVPTLLTSHLEWKSRPRAKHASAQPRNGSCGNCSRHSQTHYVVNRTVKETGRRTGNNTVTKHEFGGLGRALSNTSVRWLLSESSSA